jgi:hypothetical protein
MIAATIKKKTKYSTTSSRSINHLLGAPLPLLWWRKFGAKEQKKLSWIGV